MSFINFIKDSYTEFKYKVEWPKLSELESSTMIVTISTLIIAIFTFGTDTFFNDLIHMFISKSISLIGLNN